MAKTKNTSNLAPGLLFAENKKLYLQTVDGTLEILELQPSGGKAMSTEQFLNGYSKKLPLKLL